MNTRYEEARNVLKKCKNNCGDCLTCKEHDEAMAVAIEVLEMGIDKSIECSVLVARLREWLEELQWYKDQDLIRREDAIKAVEDVFDLYFCSTDEEDVTEEIIRIPKAEYRGKLDEERSNNL